MSKQKITLKLLKEARPHTIIAKGITIDNLDGINYRNTGDKLYWVVVRGGIDDWAFYVMLRSEIAKYNLPIYGIPKNGDDICCDKITAWMLTAKIGNKIHTRIEIEKVLKFSNKVWEKYRD